MNWIKVLGELVKWAPVLDALKGMFSDPEEALENVREWEMKKRAANDARLDRLRDREDS